jgi:hypothetical protein
MANAEEAIAEAKRLNGSSLAVRSIDVNVAVQRSRLQFIAGQAVPASELSRAKAEALELRDELLRLHRTQESARLLMLAVDVLVMSADLEGARQLVSQATAEELKRTDAAESLGDAALRALGFRESLKLTEEAPPTPAIRRIRADAYLNLGSREKKTEALESLDAIIGEGGRRGSGGRLCAPRRGCRRSGHRVERRSGSSRPSERLRAGRNHTSGVLLREQA